MAGRNNNKLTKAVRNLTYSLLADGTTSHRVWVDSGQSLSIVNRKLFSQKRVYEIDSIDFFYQKPDVAAGDTDFDELIFSVYTAGDTWSVHNAWTKGHALHTEMQNLVLKDNPSIKGTWAEFKVFLDSDHRQAVLGAAPPGNMIPVDGNFAPYLQGEWDYSTFVMPQHDVDLVTGEPLPADETNAHLLGPDLGNPLTNTLFFAGLVEAYALSRATVQPTDPSVPTGMSDSFFNLLTDSGSQEPELAVVIEGENDEPPYDQLSYPGGAVNAFGPVMVGLGHANFNVPDVKLPSFMAQCGLFEVRVAATLDGVFVNVPTMSFRVNYSEGTYKGVHALPMGQ